MASHRQYNHKRPLSDFCGALCEIQMAGFNPIAVTQLYFEDTFVFSTDVEALNAYKEMEENKARPRYKRVVGWWLGLKDFKESVRIYETMSSFAPIKVKIYWL